MTPPPNTIIEGDCLKVMGGWLDNCIDAIVTDPPYGLGFMGKDWDRGVPGIAFWSQMLRVLKPGGHLLAFGGTRTYHRLACAVEDAGFKIRDQIQWLYGSGFPKSLDVSKAIDKAAGAEREVVGKHPSPLTAGDSGRYHWNVGGEGSTDAAEQWEGWGTGLKPANEPIALARKPLSEKTVAANVLKWGTGALNIDGCRVGTEQTTTRVAKERFSGQDYAGGKPYRPAFVGEYQNPPGRWPANVIHDGSEEVVAEFPRTSPSKAGARGGTSPNPMDWGNSRSDGDVVAGHDDAGGSAARFFYCAKASKSERGKGNKHPTVKPLKLMAYLCRLVTPPGGIVLDPFAGSGSTCIAAVQEGFRFIGVELSSEYAELARRRIAEAQKEHAQ